jgi:hypothetical protein
MKCSNARTLRPEKLLPDHARVHAGEGRLEPRSQARLWRAASFCNIRCSDCQNMRLLAACQMDGGTSNLPLQGFH